ncbi:DNA-binding transcriptional regulator, AcrR family [Amycolatopsis sacchari]|uniref:DNA-binding transcriptional regulator, AcrR family n=1 Tax=Amycolatopsis sacchari TaxID=115433 RepID=A0A1I3XCV7_9PSEU|nr:TetR/AcrR family transcriptional regulator [Amycolatopsis sacchari]SFK16886.1 DNA-binding transcriptional regulator, AcrR family [Amycolatopsis sacchari]
MTRAAQGTATSRPPVRDRILAAADELFYAEGIRAVSADRIIAAAEVSKVTFYRHFPTKDDLVLAYLEGRSAVEREALERLRSPDPRATLKAIAHLLADASCAADFRGCPFINAAAEYADASHPVRQAVAAHRAWFAGVLAGLLTELDIADPAEAVDQLMMLRDGAMVGAYLGAGPGARAESLVAAGRAVVAAARG